MSEDGAYLMYPLARAILFRLNAETAHHLTMAGLALASRSEFLSGMVATMMGASGRTSERYSPARVMGIEFPNRVGLAAGFDKDATACNALHRLGFGWLELGTVTPVPQPGQSKPRMFRLPEHDALINRLGFNSSGLDRFVYNVERSDPAIIKGINIGKNSSTPIGNAIYDYLEGLQRVYAHADYVAVNVSSPNTQNLRDLQRGEMLDTLLHSLNRKRQQLADGCGKRTPLVLKISPDISASGVDAIAALLRKHRIDGVCATNTTISRERIGSHSLASETGGLSGAPLQALSTGIISSLSKNLQGEIPIIGMGGIHNADSAQEKFDAGASLVQLYTGLIYRGPKLIGEILQRFEQQEHDPDNPPDNPAANPAT